MPKVRALTQAQRDAQEISERTARNKRIIRAAGVAIGLNTFTEIAAALGLPKSTLSYRLSSGKMTISDFAKLADTLSLDDQTRARICGSKTKCRWEPG